MERRLVLLMTCAWAAIPAVTGTESVSFASGRRHTTGDPRQDAAVEAPRPLLQPAEGTDAALAPLLTRWVHGSQAVRTLEARLDRIVYDHVFQVERRCTGNCVLLPDAWRLETVPDEQPPGYASQRRDHKGRTYQWASGFHETWIRTPRRWIRIDEQRRSYESYTAPREPATNSFAWAIFAQFWLPIPFMSGASADDVCRRYTFTLLDQSNTRVLLEARPLVRDDARQWSRVTILLDPDTLRTKAVQVIDPSGNEETVYILSDVKLNCSLDRPPESLVPDLAGYSGKAY